MASIQKTNNDLANVFKKEFSRELVKFSAVIIITVLILGFLGFFIRYQVREIKSARAERQYIIESLNAIVELNNNQAKADKTLVEFEKTLPTAVEVPTKAIPLLKESAKAAGLRVDIKLGVFRQPENDQPAGVDFSLRVDGGFSGILDFLQKFENGLLIKPEQWELSPINDSEYQLTFSGIIFVRQE